MRPIRVVVSRWAILSWILRGEFLKSGKKISLVSPQPWSICESRIKRSSKSTRFISSSLPVRYTIRERNTIRSFLNQHFDIAHLVQSGRQSLRRIIVFFNRCSRRSERSSRSERRSLSFRQICTYVGILGAERKPGPRTRRYIRIYVPRCNSCSHVAR